MPAPSVADQCVAVASRLLVLHLKERPPAFTEDLIPDTSNIFASFPATPISRAAQQFLLALRLQAQAQPRTDALEPADSPTPRRSTSPVPVLAAASSSPLLSLAPASSSPPLTTLPRTAALHLIAEMLGAEVEMMVEQASIMRKDGVLEDYHDKGSVKVYLQRMKDLNKSLGVESIDYAEVRSNAAERPWNETLDNTLAGIHSHFRGLAQLDPSLGLPVDDNENSSNNNSASSDNEDDEEDEDEEEDSENSQEEDSEYADGESPRSCGQDDFSCNESVVNPDPRDEVEASEKKRKWNKADDKKQKKKKKKEKSESESEEEEESKESEAVSSAFPPTLTAVTDSIDETSDEEARVIRKYMSKDEAQKKVKDAALIPDRNKSIAALRTAYAWFRKKMKKNGVEEDLMKRNLNLLKKYAKEARAYAFPSSPPPPPRAPPKIPAPPKDDSAASSSAAAAASAAPRIGRAQHQLW
jgi:hypothetical protein